jgi:hypothetical protein
MFEKSGDLDGKINRRVCVSRKIIGSKAKFPRSKCLSQKAKLTIYNIVLLPNLLHDLKSWVCLEKHRSKLSAISKLI